MTRRPDPSFNRRSVGAGVAVQGNSLSEAPHARAVTVRQHEATDAFQAGAFCAERSQAEPAPGVVADKSHVAQVEGFQEVRYAFGCRPSPNRPQLGLL